MYVPNLIVYISFISVVKEKVLGGLTIVWLFHPDDIKTLFENEGKYPSRRSHLALKKYRKEKPEFYNNGGLLPTNGPEWARMRKAAQKPLTKQLLSNHTQVIIYLLGAIHKCRVFIPKHFPAGPIKEKYHHHHDDDKYDAGRRLCRFLTE